MMRSAVARGDPGEKNMVNDTETTPTVEPGPTIPVENMPENLRARATEINVYMREMPRLLRDSEEGRYALISGDQVLSVWDTYADALQAGYDRFGLDGRFLAQKIDSRYYERFLTLVNKP
jgi:hypothetical protein